MGAEFGICVHVHVLMQPNDTHLSMKRRVAGGAELQNLWVVESEYVA